MNVAMSATDTNSTNATRFAAGTVVPMMSARRIEAGIPSREVRRSARFTWSSHAWRTAGLTALPFINGVSVPQRRA